MRSTFLFLGLAAITATVATSAVATVPDKTVYLYGEADLAQLRSRNPAHYARAERIMAAANELCRPQPAEVSYVKYGARDVSCSDMLLRTSNPAKRQISFQLDDTRYIALVSLTDDPPRAVLAR